MITVSPVAGTLIEIGNNVVHAESYKAGDSGTRTLNFNIKPNEKTDTKTEVIGEPLDLIMIIDGSGSTIEPFNSGDNPNRRKVNVSLGDALKLAESLPEGSQVMIASYTTTFLLKKHTKKKLLRKINTFQSSNLLMNGFKMKTLIVLSQRGQKPTQKRL